MTLYMPRPIPWWLTSNQPLSLMYSYSWSAKQFMSAIDMGIYNSDSQETQWSRSKGVVASRCADEIRSDTLSE